jgi:hypothetical protein
MAEMTARFTADLDRVPDEGRRLRDPIPIVARHSQELIALTERARSGALRRADLDP